MSNQSSKFNNFAQSPSRVMVVKATGQDCAKPVLDVAGSASTLVVRNPAPAASPSATPSRSERLVVFC
jgi:hypothetical protein